MLTQDLFKFLYAEQVYTIPKTYVKITGSHESALLLSECIYNASISKMENSEFYKTYDEWFYDIHLTKQQIIFHTETLQNLNLIKSEIKTIYPRETIYYSVFFENIAEAIENSIR